MLAKRSNLNIPKFVPPRCGTQGPLCEVAPRESAGPLLGTLLGGASQFGSRAICTVVDRFPVNDGPCLPSGAAKPWCRPHPRIGHDERWIGELRDAIFTFDERYNIDHIVPLHGHFCPIIASKPPIQEMRLEKPPLLRRQRTDPSKPNSQSGVLWVHGGDDAVCIHARRVLAVFGRFSRETVTKRPKTAKLAVSRIQHADTTVPPC